MLISSYLPPSEITNDELAADFASPAWTAEKIYAKTGIRSRRAARGELVSDMAVKAAERLFDEHSIDRSSIDFLILCTQSPDYFLPSTACIVQDKLGLSDICGAFDINLGCSGFVYALSVAKGLLLSGDVSQLLIITSETYTKHINKLDRSTRTVFGDAAAAVLLTTADAGRIGKFIFGTDGSGADRLIIPGGAMAGRDRDNEAETQDSNGNIRSPRNIFMDGPEIYGFTLDTVPALIDEVLKKNSLGRDDIDIFILHQANRFILEALKKTSRLPDEKFLIDVEDTGNTVSTSIPLAIDRAMKREPQRLAAGTKALLAGFGVGYSWAGTVVAF